MRPPVPTSQPVCGLPNATAQKSVTPGKVYHESPSSGVHAEPPGPVTTTVFRFAVATQVPLDENSDSPGSAAGSLPAMLSHVCPFVVRTTGNCPFTESLWAKPRVGVQKAKQS